MFGVRLPLNFNSPYKSTSIIDFWRRWHITLSRFLRDYLYIPLGGSRKGEARRMANLMITMLLGGLWHGAGWTFVLWGGLHGIYLVINHGWRKLIPAGNAGRLRKGAGWTITMLAVVVAWVPFRAESMDGASQALSAMFGLQGVALPTSYLGYLNLLGGLGDILLEYGWIFGDAGLFKGVTQVSALFLLILIASIFPNTQQLMRRYRPAFETYRGEIPRLRYRRMEWRPSWGWAIFTAWVAVLAVLGLTRISEFLYFQF
jgi:hypothetical protein